MLERPTLYEANPDQIVQVAEGTVDEAYNYVADAFGYEILGKASDEDIDAFRAEPGALRDRFWENMLGRNLSTRPQAAGGWPTPRRLTKHRLSSSSAGPLYLSVWNCKRRG